MRSLSKAEFTEKHLQVRKLNDLSSDVCLICRVPYGRTDPDDSSASPERPVQIVGIEGGCAHIYGEQCLSGWVLASSNLSCPLCQTQWYDDVGQDAQRVQWMASYYNVSLQSAKHILDEERDDLNAWPDTIEIALINAMLTQGELIEDAVESDIVQGYLSKVRQRKLFGTPMEGRRFAEKTMDLIQSMRSLPFDGLDGKPVNATNELLAMLIESIVMTKKAKPFHSLIRYKVLVLFECREPSIDDLEPFLAISKTVVADFKDKNHPEWLELLALVIAVSEAIRETLLLSRDEDDLRYRGDAT